MVPSGIKPFPPGGANRPAEVSFARLAEFAFAALGGIQRNNVIAVFQAGHALADFNDDTAAFMAQKPPGTRLPGRRQRE